METYVPIVVQTVFSGVFPLIFMLYVAYLVDSKKRIAAILAAGVTISMFIAVMGSLEVKNNSRGRLIPGLEANAIYVAVRQYPQDGFAARRILELFNKDKRTFHYLVGCVQRDPVSNKVSNGVVYCPDGRFPQAFQVVQDGEFQNIVELTLETAPKPGE